MVESALNMTNNDAQTNGGYLIVGMASPNQSNVNKALAE